jgi:hypothetical protein
MMEAVRTSETSVDNHSTRQYNPEDSSEHHTRRRENLKSQTGIIVLQDISKTVLSVMKQGAFTVRSESCNKCLSLLGNIVTIMNY